MRKKQKKVKPRKPSAKQRRFIKIKLANIGSMTNKAAALEAGYSKATAQDVKRNILSKPGTIKAYRKAMKDAGIDDRTLAQVAKEGLTATSLNGKNAVEHPDYSTRLKFLEYNNKMRGLEAAQKVDVTSGGRVINFGLDKLLGLTNEESDPESKENQPEVQEGS